MILPLPAKQIIDAELERLRTGATSTVTPEKRSEIYLALGPSDVSERSAAWSARHTNNLPEMSTADRVRARIAYAAAQKVLSLWVQACQETDANFDKVEPVSDYVLEETAYIKQRQSGPIEHISVFKVPRTRVAAHILEMAALAVEGKIVDPAAFFYEANECWGLYGRPERMERECFIKWAVQDALYSAIGWAKNNPEDVPLAEFAILAYAGEFGGSDFRHRTLTMNRQREKAFWLWWLGEAIAAASALE